MNKAMTTALLGILLGFHAAVAGAMPAGEARAWREDLRFMASEMERTHKDLYHTVSREQFAASVAALDERIPTLERHEVIVEMARIVAAVGDGHTNIYPTRDAKIGFRTLPLSLTLFGDDLYVRAAPESQRSLIGGITVRASIYYWQEWHPQDKRDAIVPGISAPLTFDAYRANIDPALEAVSSITSR